MRNDDRRSASETGFFGDSRHHLIYVDTARLWLGMRLVSLAQTTADPVWLAPYYSISTVIHSARDDVSLDRPTVR